MTPLGVLVCRVVPWSVFVGCLLFRLTLDAPVDIVDLALFSFLALCCVAAVRATVDEDDDGDRYGADRP